MCPLSLDIMKDPVLCKDGMTYDRKGIETWFKSGKLTSPITGAELSSQKLASNYALKSLINSFISNNSIQQELELKLTVLPEQKQQQKEQWSASI